jgi:hypothetical protein
MTRVPGWLRRPFRRRRNVPAAAGDVLPAGAPLPPWPVRVDAKRASSAVMLSLLDGRRSDVDLILAGLDAATARELSREMAVAWLWAVTVLGHGERSPATRAAVAANAMAHAMLRDGRHDRDC